ncbi:hypothetical protein A3A93_02015 [Candidatus Roizmanbacteria bacterium RIFCSPLOWO2_01_FULL_38_12]|uniref:tetrahydrofolate synthase n=1 Tax=Candidatus Roizmanbacteria bacterium RIFCSPLOWO2_01_FULL_38_12 TaxID=1802061 RepID=A0A1F7IXX2_9BACT|nr:MAG: hypothetical protein A2861_01530 [Candidatus Roizmanbacteria bacterium RIFCSPHIGHO2_01_FULL_38_15]OGK35300.1 MAG: hypothetical protein A3F59_02940 [Candidatus Roizmanbacteria bacterium RIFCSPHIGHO2_12_FULL_38_13]OGK48226.1 MAG: hypothetical protein A3A93_02015 [Candidatus Roizmanbacteria bacterium RIFCSPLOWO2_01_FULL_38_12]
MKIKTYHDAEAYLESFIPKTSKWGEPSFAHARTKHFMQLLGDPQNKLQVIHIAGTSGKGSTAYITSTLLHSHGLTVGMGISPHVHDILERIQINMESISEDLFCKYLDEIIPFVEKMKASKYGQPTYFEIIIGLSYYLFDKEEVDVVVMETGLGGQYCATNTVTSSDKIAVITRIGFDHMEFLGNTLTSIAQEKVKIIQPQNTVITFKQDPEVMTQIKNEASKKNAKLISFDPQENIKNIRLTEKKTTFDFEFDNKIEKNIEISLLGEYQAENTALALLTFKTFMNNHMKFIYMSKVRKSLCYIHIPGRMEIRKYKGKQLIIDGAHNGQKMEAFIKSLVKIYPNQKFIFLISFKKGKDYKSILQHITCCAQTIIITSFENTNQGMGQLYSEDPKKIGAILEKLSVKNYQVIPDLTAALAGAMDHKENIVITGSLYLIGEIYNLLAK